eukprot:782058-Prymnesium_polylepis.1
MAVAVALAAGRRFGRAWRVGGRGKTRVALGLTSFVCSRVTAFVATDGEPLVATDGEPLDFC